MHGSRNTASPPQEEGTSTTTPTEVVETAVCGQVKTDYYKTNYNSSKGNNRSSRAPPLKAEATIGYIGNTAASPPRQQTVNHTLFDSGGKSKDYSHNLNVCREDMCVCHLYGLSSSSSNSSSRGSSEI